MDFSQGSSERLVLPAILGERRAWREIQNLYMRFVDPSSEVSAPMYCFEGSTLRCLDPGIDQPDSINLDFSIVFILFP